MKNDTLKQCVKIVKEVAEKHGVTFSDMKGDQQSTKTRQARSHAMMDIRDNTDASWSEIAEMFNREVSSVFRLVKIHRAKRAKYDETLEVIGALRLFKHFIKGSAHDIPDPNKTCSAVSKAIKLLEATR